MLNIFGYLKESIQKDFNSIIPQNKKTIFTIKGKIALEQIIKSAHLQGKKIILPAFTWEGFIPIFIKYNITPVFVDITPDTFHVDYCLIDEKINPEVAAIIIDHIYGLPDPTIEALRDLALKNDIVLIEDCARALGARHRGRLVGSFGQYAFYSLHKCMPLSKGGLGVGEITSRDLLPSRIETKDFTNLALKLEYPLKKAVESGIRRLRNATYLNDNLEEGEIKKPALDPRELDDLNKTLFYLYLPFYRRNLESRRSAALVLREELEDLGFEPQKDPYGEHIYTAVGVKVPNGCNRDKAFSLLRKSGIETQILWHPTIVQLEDAIKTWGIDPKDYPHALELARKILVFPYTVYSQPDEIQEIKRMLQKML
jgi:dTDP-4-amino-4,6-dideoxygalactose transaminase